MSLLRRVAENGDVRIRVRVSRIAHDPDYLRRGFDIVQSKARWNAFKRIREAGEFEKTLTDGARQMFARFLAKQGASGSTESPLKP